MTGDESFLHFMVKNPDQIYIGRAVHSFYSVEPLQLCESISFLAADRTLAGASCVVTST